MKPINPQELLLSYLGIYDTYHHHKELMAFSATALYLGGSAALLVQEEPFWLVYSLSEFTFFLLLLIFSGILGCVFIFWQLYKRRDAAFTYEACLNLCTTWLTALPSRFALRGEISPKGGPGTKRIRFPKALADEIERVKKQNRYSLWFPMIVTLSLLFSWSVFVGYQVCSTYPHLKDLADKF